MTKKYKDNVIPFPTPKEQEAKKEEDNLNFLSNDCVDCSHYLMEVLEEFITTGQVSETLMDMDFRDETKQESRDMFVIVNMLNAMFNRWYGIPHGLHQTLDNAYVKIKEMILINEKAQEELYTFVPEDGEKEFIFEPDFDLDPEGDDDDTN
jgi:hypothetical protein